MMTSALDDALYVFEEEARAILNLKNYLTDDFNQVVDLILTSNGRVIVTGLGKSGIIGRKISSSLSSTGTPSLYLHPTEAFHGDLGMIQKNDVILAITNSGETDEILKLIPYLKTNNNKLISITGNPQSTVARNSDFHLNSHTDREVCPLDLAPTTSATTCLVIGDALVVALMKKRNFKEENYATYHPGGSLGRRLLTKVETVMRSEHLPMVKPESMLHEIINSMSCGRLGLTLVCDSNDKLAGIITDGDLRRVMEKMGKESFDMKAEEMMTRTPKAISLHTKLSEAEDLMNRYKITSLVVLDDQYVPVGVVQIYDLV